MLITVIFLLIFAQACGKHGQRLIPGFTDIHVSDIARSGYDTFWKVDGNMWTTIISTDPVKKNAVTRITFFLLSGGTFHIGFGARKSQLLWNNHVGGYIPATLSYFTENGQKYGWANGNDYSTPSYAGDNVTMIIDTRKRYNSVSYQRNKLPLGVACSGISEWGDLYIMFSIHWAGHRIKIVDYQVIDGQQQL